MNTWLPLLAGLALLIVGGDVLVRGAVQAAQRIGISPLVIGLTLVGFGTSTPELVTSVQAGLTGSPGIAFGNIVGSNIANILLIAGVSALLFPIIVNRTSLRRDAVVMLAAAIIFGGLAILVPLGRLAGGALLAMLAAYLWLVVRQDTSRAAEAAGHLGASHLPGDLGKPLLLALCGLGLVILGGGLFVNGAVAIARGMGVSETVIGLTIVAVGTSMPELVTSVIAALKRQGDVAFGNIVGSNIYNILGIGGATAVIAPSHVPNGMVRFDVPVMIGVSLVLVVFAATSLRIGRREGTVLLGGYIAYLWVLWPSAGG